MQSCFNGERQSSYAGARQRLGITRESVWIQQTPAGDIAVVLLEAEDIGAAFEGMATSDDPFDRFFRDVHGIDLADGMTPREQVLDYRGS